MVKAVYKILSSLDLDSDDGSLYSESGGSINAAFSFISQEHRYFIKINLASDYAGMMNAEARGLSFLAERASGMYEVPTVRYQGVFDDWQYLIMDFINRNDGEAELAFAKALHQLHSSECTHFGFEHDNYIGSLIQTNGIYHDASSYYIDSRLQPQLKMAINNGFILKRTDDLLKVVDGLLARLPPAPIHGDLWNGNSFYNESGLPVFIDPAISFGLAEMDLAMMKLFGGYDPIIFDYYEQLNPTIQGWKDRLPIFQLYYLLVHLNIFGMSYLNQVNNTISKCLRIG